MSRAPREAGPRRIAGYELEGLLGRGGTSRVYVARHQRLERRVALKLFEVREETPANAVPRLLREAKLLARLDHENVVRCFDFGEQDGRVYLVLELVEGRSLKERLDEVGALPEAEALRIAVEIARALEHAHGHGIVHRDVKPGNVLLAKDGRVKLTDFGLAKGGEGLDLTLPGTMIGTPQYLSPEQARSPRQADERSDLYSLGATLYHMLTGRPPHVGDSLTAVISDILFAPIIPPEQIRTGISTATSRVVARLLARDRGRRPHTATDAIADLERAAAPAPAGGELPGLSWEEAGHAARSSRRRGLVAAAVAIALALVVIGVAQWRSGDDDTAPTVVDEGATPPPFDADDIASGRLAPAAAWRALESTPSGEARAALLGAVIRATEERARLLAVRASSAARRAVAAGRLEDALDVFDAEVDAATATSLGATRGALPSPLAEALETGVAEARRAVAEDLSGRAGRRANDEIEIELDRLSGELLALMAARRFGESLRRVDHELEVAETRVAELFAAGVRAVVPESRDARPSPAWHARATQSYRAALERVKRSRLQRAIDAARENALQAVRAWSLPDGAPPLRAEIEAALDAEARRALGIEVAELPGEPGELSAAIEAHVARLDEDARRRDRTARRRLETEVLVAVEAAIRDRDVVAARAAAEELGDGAVQDPWLGLLVAAIPGIAAIEEDALDALEEAVGTTTELWVRGIRRRGRLVEVDRTARRIRFDSPRFEVRFDEIEAQALVALSDEADPRSAIVLLHYSGRSEEVDARLAAHGDDPRVRELAPVLARRRDELARRASDRAEEANERLDEFDAAVAAGDPADVVVRGEAILLDAGLRRLEPVQSRQRAIQRAVEQAERDLRTAQARDVVKGRTRAEATFHDDGVVDLVHRFKTSVELDDFELPGKEWGVRGDSLTSVSASERAMSSGLFVNRPGLRRALPFDPGAPIRVAFDVEFPYEQEDPTLFGVRLLATCFIVRSFGENDVPGQANAWSGDLDDFRGYVFEPALGESRPRKKGATREFSFRRGERYRLELEWEPSPTPEARLRVDGDVIYRWRGDEPPRATGLEIRSRTPVVIRDLRLSGTIPGTERRMR